MATRPRSDQAGDTTQEAVQGQVDPARNPPFVQPTGQSTSRDAGVSTVWLRNDSPGIRIVHDHKHQPVQIAPGRAVQATLHENVLDLLQFEVNRRERRGLHDTLCIVDKRSAQEANEGRGPRPTAYVTQTQEARNTLAEQGGDMPYSEFHDNAKEVLGAEWTFGESRPRREEIITALRGQQPPKE